MKTLNDYRETNLFDDLQMFEIRWGLKRGLDVSVYADPKFHRCQMEEIREGLEEYHL